MPAPTLDYRISCAYTQLKNARQRGDVNTIRYWRLNLDSLLDEKLAAMQTT